MAHYWKEKTDINPIFGQIKDLESKVLPKNSDVLLSLFYYQKNSAKAKNDAYSEVAKKVIDVWELKVTIPIIGLKSVMKRIESLHESYQKVIKAPASRSHEIRKQFSETNQNQLFDISKCKCIKICTCDAKMSGSDMRILNNQRSGNPSILTDIVTDNDNNNNNDNSASAERKKETVHRKEKKRDSDECVDTSDITSAITMRSGRTLVPVTSKKPKLDSIALVIDRYNIPERQAASLITATLKAYGHNTIVDRNKVRRAKETTRNATADQYMTELQNFISNVECWGIFFDDKKDMTNRMERNEETGNFHAKKGLENHCALVLQPGDRFYAHVSTSDSTAECIFKCITEKITKDQINPNKIFVLGCDGAPTNTGKNNGIFSCMI